MDLQICHLLIKCKLYSRSQYDKSSTKRISLYSVFKAWGTVRNGSIPRFLWLLQISVQWRFLNTLRCWQSTKNVPDLTATSSSTKILNNRNMIPYIPSKVFQLWGLKQRHRCLQNEELVQRWADRLDRWPVRLWRQGIPSKSHAFLCQVGHEPTDRLDSMNTGNPGHVCNCPSRTPEQNIPFRVTNAVDVCQQLKHAILRFPRISRRVFQKTPSHRWFADREWEYQSAAGPKYT